LVIETIKEVKETIEKWNNKKAMKVVRQIGFLKFLNPKYFDKFYFDKN
jgi:Zn finger protein HypA/HybF involved in hydrogenase expression